MESVMKLFQRTDDTTKKADTENEKLLLEIKNVSHMLAYNNCWFDMECDSDLIDACIYQREELQARYRYLLNLAKQKGITSAVSKD